jgi:hypothetical protein
MDSHCTASRDADLGLQSKDSLKQGTLGVQDESMQRYTTVADGGSLKASSKCIAARATWPKKRDNPNEGPSSSLESLSSKSTLDDGTNPKKCSPAAKSPIEESLSEYSTTDDGSDTEEEFLMVTLEPGRFVCQGLAAKVDARSRCSAVGKSCLVNRSGSEVKRSRSVSFSDPVVTHFQTAPEDEEPDPTLLHKYLCLAALVLATAVLVRLALAPYEQLVEKAFYFGGIEVEPHPVVQVQTLCLWFQRICLATAGFLGCLIQLVLLSLVM